MKLWLKILLCAVIVNLLGGLGAFVTASEIRGWYSGLDKPPGVPPNWVFGPVWTLLYTMMGAAVALIWHRVDAGEGKKRALVWFGVQMVLNLIWTPVFFGMHELLIALILIFVLLIAIAITIRSFARVAPVAALLLVPYLCWVSYATYLNAGYWFLNR